MTAIVGLCSDSPTPDDWYPEGYDHQANAAVTRKAKNVCASCPAMAACLQYAIDNDERHGIWGGFTERERVQLDRSRANDSPTIRRRFYDSGMNDGGIARAVGISTSGIQEWRRAQGLPPNLTPQAVKFSKRLADYEECQDPVVLAVRWGCSLGAVQTWLRKHGDRVPA